MTVPVSKPPMMTTAKGRAVSAPTPVDKAAGNSPSMAISAVMTMGRTRCVAPACTAASRAMPVFRNSRMRETRMTLFWMAMPNSATKPTSAATEIFRPANGSAMIPPTAEYGTIRRISPAKADELKVMNSRKKMAMSVMGKIIASRRSARCSFSNAPVQTMRYPGGTLICAAKARRASATTEPMSRSRIESLMSVRRSFSSR